MMYNKRLRRGTVAVLVAVCLIPMMAVVAIVLDGGVLLDDRRQAQTAADAAALAAATDLFNHYPANKGADPKGTAKQSALTTAKADGYANDGTTSVVTVNIPPKSGPFTSKAGYVEILITYFQPRYFSNVLGSGSLKVTARSVARGRYTPANPGILLLDPSGSNTLNDTAGGNVTVTNGGAIDVNSTSSSGASLTNTGNVTAATINLGGAGYNDSNSGSIIGTINYSQPPVPDPLALLPEPSQPALPTLPPLTLTQLGNNYSTNNGVNDSGNTGQTINLYPGYYAGIKVTNNDQIVLNPNTDGSPGIYYIGSQGLSITGQGGITGSNVMLYSAGTGNISLTGSGNMTLSPPTSGTYQGISVFQERSSTKQISITAQGNMNVSGTFYVAAAKVAITGQGNFVNTIGSQWIAYDLSVTGSGSLNVSYDGLASPLRQIRAGGVEDFPGSPGVGISVAGGFVHVRTDPHQDESSP